MSATRQERMETLGRAVTRMDGKIVLPEHGRWEDARLAWNGAYEP